MGRNYKFVIVFEMVQLYLMLPTLEGLVAFRYVEELQMCKFKTDIIYICCSLCNINQQQTTATILKGQIL